MESLMKLKQLFKEMPVVWKGNKETEVSFLTANSKTVAPGTLFIAKRGKAGDGHRFIAEAISAGAAAVLTDTFDPFLSVTQIIYPDVNSLESELARRFYHDPASKLSIFGITGTSGKTTTSFLIKYLLEEPSGLIGTVSWMTGRKVLPASLTTPDLLTLMQLFHEMVEEKCKSAIMEVSSHALDQGRVKDIPFKVAVYTNLSQDHLDYHSTMEEYAEVKSRLFTNLDSLGTAIINGDDPWSSRMIQQCKAKIIRYGLNNADDLSASDLDISSRGMTFKVYWQEKTAVFKTALIGRFNVYNILAATAVALTQGMPLEAIGKKLEGFLGVPGRLERVVNRKGLQVFVDYSHKPDALKNVLETLQELKKGRLITVFGCGGNRDVQNGPKWPRLPRNCLI